MCGYFQHVRLLYSIYSIYTMSPKNDQLRNIFYDYMLSDYLFKLLVRNFSISYLAVYPV